MERRTNIMAALLFIVFLLLIVINVPIAIALALSSVLIMAIIGEIPLIMLPQKMFAALDSFPLMAAPFFILAGKLMEIGGISERLVNFANSLVGQLKGGLAHVSLEIGRASCREGELVGVGEARAVRETGVV